GGARGLENGREVRKRGPGQDEGVAEQVFLRRLQRLHEHKVNGEDAVHRHDEQQARVAEPARPRRRIHARASSGGSNALNSSSSTPSRKGTSISDSADAGPNCPPLMASHNACVPITGNTTRPAVSSHTLARSANAVVTDTNTASARKGRSSGTVTSQKRRQALRHSSSAHSHSPAATALMPARRKTAMNELPRQMLNSVTARKDHALVPTAWSTVSFRCPMNAA